MDNDFTHVYAVKSLNEYQWLVIQPTCAYTDLVIKSKSEYPHIRLIAGQDAKIIKVTAMINPVFRGSLNCFTCVEQIKALLGIKSFWTWTPKQLYKGLIGGRYG